jgi:plastocyanin
MRRSLPAALLLVLLPPAHACSVTLTVVDGSGLALSDAVASLHAEGAPASATGAEAVIRQEDLQFQPLVLPVQVGTEVQFPNLDRVAHHVYSFSQAKRFELRLYRGLPERLVRFDTPGVVVLGCNIHDWMLSYVYVVDTPWFASSDAEGRMRLHQVPAGVYELRLWHPRLSGDSAPRSYPLELGACQEITLDFMLEVDPPDPRFLSPRQRAEKE